MKIAKQEDVATTKIRKVVKAIIIRHGFLLILKRTPNTVDSVGLWDLPGGTVEPGEHVVDALVREVKEETDLDAAITGHCVKFESKHYHKPEILLCEHYYMHILDGAIKLSEEHTESYWMPLDEIRGYKFTHAFESNKELLMEKINARWPRRDSTTE
jgi:8-oxo-dGTP diphosphatase